MKEYQAIHFHVLHTTKGSYNQSELTPTMYKILIPSVTVVGNDLVPVDQLSEEAAEACDQQCYLHHQNFARKLSGVFCILDKLNRLMLSLDPVLISLRSSPTKKTKFFPKKTKDMLLPPKLSLIQKQKDLKMKNVEMHYFLMRIQL